DFPAQAASGFTVEQAATSGANDAFVSKLNAAGGTLAYSTFLGGTGAEDGNSIAVDGSGNAYVTGTTQSADFPDQGASIEQPTIGGGKDAFIARYDTTGAVTFATFLGGSADEEGFGIAVDGSGNAYVAGTTASADFPTQDPADSTHNGSDDGFVAKYSSSGNQVYATFHGGSLDDKFHDIAVDPDGTAYVTGTTTSNELNFPLLNAAQPVASGSSDAVVAAYNTDGERIYSTFIGGTGNETGNSIDVDENGNAFLTGFTDSNDLPTVAPTQSAFGGGSFDAFVSGFDGSGALIYSTYLGGLGSEEGTGIAIDGSAMVVTGNTGSSDFPRLNA
ncbi:MAG: SBBP repeat-containing protein, partial [Alphaproteobacteria bacterium]|nr:SBBP repeat-containing protein [Alphaproteobacteria bacterium]